MKSIPVDLVLNQLSNTIGRLMVELAISKVNNDLLTKGLAEINEKLTKEGEK